MSSLLVERKNLTEKLDENQLNSAILEKIVALTHNVKLQTRGSQIVHVTISAAGVLESELQTQPAYLMRHLEQVVHYSCPQNFQQASESCMGTKDVLLSMPGGLQKRVTMPISSRNLHQSFNQPQQNFNQPPLTPPGVGFYPFLF